MTPRFNAALFTATLMVFSFSFPLYGAEQERFEDLPSLVAAALAANPELKASDARWQMFRNRVLHAGRFEDPMLMLKIQNGVLNDPLNFQKDPMTQKVVGISQQFPFWGKRALRAEVATREADSYRWLYEERKIELARMVKETYYRLYLVDRERGIVEKNLGIIDDFIAQAESKYAVGQGAQQDIFKAQLEHSKLLDLRINLDQQRTSLRASLNALLDRPADTPVGPIPDISLTPFTLTAEELRRTADESRPLLKSLHALIEKGESGRKLAERDYYPDFTVSLEYMQRDPVNGEEGLDMYGLGVTFNLPVFRRHRHEMVAEADSTVRMAQAELEAARNEIRAGIADLTAQLERRRKLVELYRTGIIPQAEQMLESATIGYRVNKAEFLMLLDSRMTLFNYEREYYESLAEYRMKMAQLEALIGKDL